MSFSIFFYHYTSSLCATLILYYKIFLLIIINLQGTWTSQNFWWHLWWNMLWIEILAYDLIKTTSVTVYQLCGRANWFVTSCVWFTRGECCIRTCAKLVLASLLLNLHSPCRNLKLLCVSLRVWSFLFWPAALILPCLFMGRCLCFYMIFLLKYLFAIVVIVGCPSTVGVPKCFKAWSFNNNNNNKIIIIIFIYCNWVVTRWQWLFYTYTKHEIGYY